MPAIRHITTTTRPPIFAGGLEHHRSAFAAQPPAVRDGLGAKIVRIGRLALREPQYRNHLAAMLASRGAFGLSEAAYFVLLQRTGSPGVAASAAMVFESSRSLGALLGHHQRDNEDFLVPAEDTSRRERLRWIRRLGGWGLSDCACTLGLLACAQVVTRLDTARSVLAVVIGLQISKTYLATRQVAAWNCAKIHLGDEGSRQQQRSMNRTIGAIEHVAFGLMSTTAAASIYLGLHRRQPPDALHTACLALLGASSLLGLLASGSFVRASPTRLSPEPPPPDDNVRRLWSLAGKARAFAHLLVNEPEYRKHAAAMTLSKVGLGLIHSGYLGIINSKGRASDVAIILALEDFARIFSGLWAHHQRDDEDVMHGAADARRMHFERRLAGCAIADAAVVATLVYGLRVRVGPVLRPLLVGVKAAEAYVRGREMGYWSCLKLYLGHAEARRDQRGINRTIAAFELLTLSVISHALSVTSYALSKTTTHCLVAVGLGAMLTCAARAFFYAQAESNSARELPDESRPLLQSA